MELPDLFAGFGIVSSYIAAHRAKFCSAVTDKYLAIKGFRMAGDIQRLIMIKGSGLPDFLAVFSVDRNKTAILWR